MVAQLTLNTFKQRVIGETLVLMSDNTTVVVYLKKQGWHGISRHVQIGYGDHCLVKSVHSYHNSRIRFREEHSHWPFESSVSNLSHRM